MMICMLFLRRNCRLNVCVVCNAEFDENMNKTKHDTIQVANSKLEHHCIEVKLSYKVYEVLCLDDLALVGGMG